MTGADSRIPETRTAVDPLLAHHRPAGVAPGSAMGIGRIGRRVPAGQARFLRLRHTARLAGIIVNARCSRTPAPPRTGSTSKFRQCIFSAVRIWSRARLRPGQRRGPASHCSQRPMYSSTDLVVQVRGQSGCGATAERLRSPTGAARERLHRDGAGSPYPASPACWHRRRRGPRKGRKGLSALARHLCQAFLMVQSTLPTIWASSIRQV